MGKHPTDDLEALAARVPTVRGIVANAERMAREALAALPDEDVQAVHMLPRWTVPGELEGAAYRSARWAVAATHGREHPGKAPPPPVARLDELTDEERAHLHGLVVARAHVAHGALNLDLPPHGEGWPTVPTLPEEGGMLAWTFRLLGHLEAYLDKCTDAPEADRTWMREELDTFRGREETAWGAGTALACWHLRMEEIDRGPRWLNMVALAVWVLEVAPRVAHARRPVAMKLVTLQGLTSTLSRGGVEVLAPTGAPQAARAWVHTATLDGEALTRILRGVALLDTPMAPRIVAFLAHKIQRRIDPRDPLEWRGGNGLNAWETLAAELNIEDKKRVREVRDVVETLGHLHYRTPTGREVGGLWTTYLHPGGGRGKVGRLIVTPNAGIGSDVDDADTGKDRFLVPIPELPDYGWCAPMVGTPQNHGAISRLWLWTLCRLREHAGDLERGNGVLIEGATWATAGNEVRVTTPAPLLVPRLIARWTRDGDDGPAVLEEVAPNRYHLAEHLVAERAFLEEAGRRTIQGSTGGKNSSARRAHPTMRRGKKPPG